MLVVAIFYILGSFLFKEIHPFSFFPMYNSFPNWSYVFYLSDSQNKPISSKEFNSHSCDMAHIFYSICQAKHIKYGNGMESTNQLSSVGNEIVDLILKNKLDTPGKYHTIKLHRIYFYYWNNTIKTKNEVICERVLE